MTKRRALAGAGIAAVTTTALIIHLNQPAPCAIVGDCIAVGLASVNRQCDASAKVGEGSSAIARRQLPGRYAWGYLSIGSNDPTNPNLAANMREARRRMNADRVVWILPVHPRAAAVMRQVAAERPNDRLQGFRPGHDNVHPIGYQSLDRAAKTQL